MNTVIDSAARAQSLDPTASFCVTAPAGSGKTELLIQRYLCLLSRVGRPEQVLAITFTRKAAAEMRARVLEALQSARSGEACGTPHQQVTRSLARRVLAADENAGWHLVRDISRLNIKTIDSFCAGLARQMPVLSQFGGLAAVRDDATELYAEAVHELYKLLDEGHPVATDLRALMLHFDNDWQRLQELLITMLARREQWRSYVGVHHTPQESEAYLLAAVASLVQDELQPLSRLLAPHQAELLELMRFSAANQSKTPPEVFPDSTPRHLEGWSSLRNLLLTKEGSWRKKLTKTEGFPAGKGELQHRREQLRGLLEELQKIDGLQSALVSTNILPVIATGSASWQLVLHLSRLLPTLAAQLLLVFHKHGVVDHSHIAQSALLALGEDEAPTELALRLDYRIEHILVDEFQDTAVTQFDLVCKLTRGWGEYNTEHPEAPRTLMIVGDGMQSIYAFRGANVGLFLKARREGFNGVALTHLKLRCNFRSDAGVVDWVNHTFQKAFPTQNVVHRSQVVYSPATAVRSAIAQVPVALHGFHGEHARSQEVAFVCQQIAGSVGEGRETIAVLARSRSHLQPIIQRLKELKISYNAPELDSLLQSPVVADLLTLCRALANHADRLAWMALLRAPWCGLQLADLLRVAHFSEAAPWTPVWAVLQSPQLSVALTEDGRVRLQHIMPILHQALNKRDRLGLRVWIEQAWVGLGGPECAPNATGLLDAENFLQLIEQAEVEGVGLDIPWLLLRLQKRFMSAGDPDSKVHLMTLHKAKGLEFDRVFLPQLDRPPRRDGREILLWDEHSTAEGDRLFLLAADDHSAGDVPTLYSYLRVQRHNKRLLETTRLLYVGATRAVSHVVLTASIKWDEQTGVAHTPARQSLLSSIWQTFAQQMTVHDPDAAQDSNVAKNSAALLTRLVRETDMSLIVSPEVNLSSASTNMRARTDNYLERCIGVVVHRALEELSRRLTLPETIDEHDTQCWRMALQRKGLWGEALEAALQGVHSSVERSLRRNGRGRWLLSADHAQARSEWALTVVGAGGSIQDIVIDRSFVDRVTGERWVVDYKNSRPAPGESLRDFAARESVKHGEQLQKYRDALRLLGKEALRCALFFTCLGHLHAIPELDFPALES